MNKHVSAKSFGPLLLVMFLTLVFSVVAPAAFHLAPLAEAKTPEEVQKDIAIIQDRISDIELKIADPDTTDEQVTAYETQLLIQEGELNKLQAELELTLRAQRQDIPTASSSRLKNPLQGAGGLPQIIGNATKGLLTLAGAISLLIFTWGGLQMIISQGDAGKYDKGKQTLIWAIIGLVVIFTSYALVSTIVEVLGG